MKPLDLIDYFLTCYIACISNGGDLMITCYGSELARGVNGVDLEEAGCDCDFLIIGIRTFIEHRNDFDGLNKDRVLVFIVSDNSFLEVYGAGFRRCFKVASLVSLTTSDVLYASHILPETLIELHDIVLLQQSVGSLDGDSQGLETYNRLVEAIGRRDYNLFCKTVVDSEDILSDAAGKVRELIDLIKRADCSLDGYRELKNSEGACEEVRLLKGESERLRKQVNELSSSNLRSAEVISALEEDVRRISLEKKDLISKIDEYDKQLMELRDESDVLKQQMDTLRQQSSDEYARVSVDLEESEKRCVMLRKEIEQKGVEHDEACAKIAELEGSITTKDEQYNELVAEYNETVNNVSRLKDCVLKQQVTIEKYKDAEDRLDSNAVIKKLQEQLAAAAANKFDIDDIRKSMPIIGNTFALAAQKIVVIKEVKTALYMNSFLLHLNDVCYERIYRTAKKSYCIVVFDMMLQDFRVFKYKTHNFFINAAPAVTSTQSRYITVVNQFDIAFLKNTLGLDKFDYLFVVDRLGLSPASVKHSSAVSFFMVDSIRDINEFNLGKSNLIVYGKPLQPTQSTITVFPNGDLFNKNREARAVQFHREKVMQSIFKISGIV